MAVETRYDRHLALKDFGAEGQRKLSDARVLVVGAGGLGCPVLQYLVAAGVGSVIIVDRDVVSLSNLHRQVLYATEDIGKPKAAAAAQKLRLLNPEVSITAYQLAITPQNAPELVEEVDIVLDCSDNFTTRYAVNDICVLLDKPLIFGAIFRYEGQVAVFNVADAEGVKTNYRHLFTLPPGPAAAPDCNDAGVLGVLPGIIGMLQAGEAIKLIGGIGAPLSNKLLCFDLLESRSYTTNIPFFENADRHIPSTPAAYRLTDYAGLCSRDHVAVSRLNLEAFLREIALPGTVAVDVRELSEGPEPGFDCLKIPLSVLQKGEIPDIDARQIIVFCQSGKRSLAAAGIMRSKFGEARKISHLEGGLKSRYL